MDRRVLQAPSVRVDLVSPRLAVAVVGAQPPSDDDWNDYVETTTALGDAHHRTVVFTAGGAPTALQRAEFERTVSSHSDVRLAVIHADSKAASRWLRPHSTQAFAPHELDAAFAFLELTARERARVMLLARRLARELDVARHFFGPQVSVARERLERGQAKPRS